MFLLKKLISKFLLPLPVVVILLLLGLFFLLFTKRQKTGKACVLLSTVLLMAFSFKPVPAYLLHRLEVRYKPLQLTGLKNQSSASKPRFNYIVVLAEGFFDDPSLPATSQLSMITLARVVEGVRLYRKNPGSKLVVSGGRVFGEAAAAQTMKAAALGLGVKADDILVEDRSVDTVSEVHYLKPLIGGSPFALVTSASHMPRAMLLFQWAGMHPVAAPANFLVRKSSSTFGFYFPVSDNLRNAELALHEYLGILWAKIALRGPYRKALHQD